MPKPDIPCPRLQQLKQKILIISAHKRSLVIFRGSLIKDLISQGLDVHVAAPELDIPDTFSETLIAFGVTPHPLTARRVSLNPMADLSYYLKLRQLLNKIRPDIVLSYNVKPAIYGTLAAWQAGVPIRAVLMAGLGFGFAKPSSNSIKIAVTKAIARSLMAIALRRSTVVIFQNPDDRETMFSLGIISKNHPTQVVAGSGVDLNYFYPHPLTSEKTSFLMLSRLLVSKGVREYVAAAKEIRSRHPNSTFILAGDIDINPDAITPEELESWQQEGHIDYLGRVSDVRPLLAACSVYVLPSAYPEGVPRSILEALATGRAIVTSDAPGCRETVKPGKNGFLIEPRNCHQLVKVLDHLCTAPQLVAQMGAESLKLAQEKFDVRQVNADMLKALGLQMTVKDKES